VIRALTTPRRNNDSEARTLLAVVAASPGTIRTEGKPIDGEAGPLVFEEQQDMRSIMEIAAEHGIEIPPPIA